jgi:hypothetical protein
LKIYVLESICYGGIFDYDTKKEKLEEVLLELENPDIWNDPESAQQLGKEKSTLETVVNGLDHSTHAISDATELLKKRWLNLSFAGCFRVKWMNVMRLWIFNQALAEQKLKTGPI